MLGENVVATFHEGVLEGDLTGIVLLMAANDDDADVEDGTESDDLREIPVFPNEIKATTAKQHLRAAAQEALGHPSTGAGHRAELCMLRSVLGEDVLAALCTGFSTGDLTPAVPLLAAEHAKPYLLQAAEAAFLAACDDGDADAVAMLLQGAIDGNGDASEDHTEYGDPCYEDPEYGDTALTRAVRRGHAGVVRSLVESGSTDPNMSNGVLDLPLLLAILHSPQNGIGCVEALLAADSIDPNLVADDRALSCRALSRHATPLAAAATVAAESGGDWECMRVLASTKNIDLSHTIAVTGLCATVPCTMRVKCIVSIDQASRATFAACATPARATRMVRRRCTLFAKRRTQPRALPRTCW